MSLMDGLSRRQHLIGLAEVRCLFLDQSSGTGMRSECNKSREASFRPGVGLAFENGVMEGTDEGHFLFSSSLISRSFSLSGVQAP